jgi:hypothetical protein
MMTVIMRMTTIPCRMLDHTQRLRMKRDCDEVFPGILVGSGDTIKNVGRLFKEP